VSTVFRFHVFEWLSQMDGFGYPMDVYTGAIFLGTLEVFPEGVKVALVQTPFANIAVARCHLNNFKTQEQAAQALHRLWLVERMPKADPEALYNE
jgi:hypothetical protein